MLRPLGALNPTNFGFPTGASPDASAASTERLLGRLGSRPGALRAEFPGFSHCVWVPFRIVSDKLTLSDIATPRQAGRITHKNELTKRRRRSTMRQVIRADLDPRSRPNRRPRRGRSRAVAAARGDEPDLGESPGNAAFPPPAAVPTWARASGRAGEGDPLFAAGAGLALLDACPAPRSARRRRAALAPGAAERRRLRQDPAPQRRRRRAARPALRRWATPLGLRRSSCRSGATSPAGRPASTPPARRRGGAARPGLSDPNGLASGLKACAGEGDPVSAAAKAAALVFSAFPDAPAAEAEILALWVFDLVIAIRLRWARPLPLIAGKFWTRL